MGRVISVVFQNPATALNPRMVVREQLLDPMRVHNLVPRPSRRSASRSSWSSPVCPAPPPRFFPASFRAASASASQLPVPCR